MCCNRDVHDFAVTKFCKTITAGAVVPIDNLSMVVSIIFSYMIFKKMSAKSSISIHIIIADTYLCFYGLNLKFTNLCNFT